MTNCGKRDVGRRMNRSNSLARPTSAAAIGLVLAAMFAAVAQRALAQSPPESSWPPPTETIVVTAAPAASPMPVPSSENASSGICDGFLPPEPRGKQAGGTTLFWYHVTSGGEVRDVRLYRSSGNSTLDAAALACANGAYRRPAIISGTPADVVSIGAVDWAHTPSPDFEAGPDGHNHDCRMWYPPVAVRNGQQGSVTVGFRIGTDGSTTDATIVDSSGSRALDSASLKCVAAFRYFPSYQNDQPVQADRSVRFVWRLIGFPNQ